MKNVLSILAATTISMSGAASGALVEFTLDSSASTITVTGTFENVALSQQTPGSMTIGYVGFLGGDLQPETFSIDTHGVSSLFQPVPQQPIPTPGEPGSAAYGFRTQTPDSGDVRMAISSIGIYLSTVFRPPLDIADGTFAAPDVGFFIDGGSLYFSSDVFPLTGADLHGYGAPNRATAPGTFATANDMQTLTIPIETTFSLSVLNADDLTLTFFGQIVATRAVPEPTATLLLLSACGALLIGRSTARRSGASRGAQD